MVYTPPSVTVSSIANSRIINISEDARLPAIIGTGPEVRTTTDTALARGSANFDLLPTSGAAGSVVIAQVAAYPGAPSSDSRWQVTSGTPTHWNASGSGGALYWADTEIAGIGKPLLGETYYVSYTQTVPANQYEPQTFTDSKDVAAFYGSEETGIKVGVLTGSGSIVTGANLALENGAPAVIAVQLSNGSSYASSTTWDDAYQKLEKKDNIAYVVPLASGSVGKLAAHTSGILHVNSQSTPVNGHERSLIVGASAGKTVENVVTDTTAIADKRVIYVVPGKELTRTLASGTVITLDGAWAGAALAGLLTSQDKVITPATGKVIAGLTIPDSQYTPFELNRMANNGALLLTSRNGIVKVRHGITTDPTDASTQEISVVAGDDLVRRITRNKLTQRFVGKGIVIDDATIASVEATVRTIWGAMQRDALIQSFGTRTDPTTGEVPITANRDLSDPTKINVTGSIRFLFPLNFINVEFFIFV